MNVYEAIAKRRTIKRYTAEAIPRDVIERILDAAVWAPNHHLTEPWRFTVLTGAAKDHLAELRRQQVASTMPDTTKPQALARLKEVYERIAGAAAMIIVSAADGPNEEITFENRLATAAVTQNLLLAATAEGLATFWSSSLMFYEPVRQYAGIRSDEHIIAVVHLGFPAQEHPGKRTPAAKLTSWMGDGEAAG